jgi:hypothetical protein
LYGSIDSFFECLSFSLESTFRIIQFDKKRLKFLSLNWARQFLNHCIISALHFQFTLKVFFVKFTSMCYHTVANSLPVSLISAKITVKLTPIATLSPFSNMFEIQVKNNRAYNHWNRHKVRNFVIRNFVPAPENSNRTPFNSTLVWLDSPFIPEYSGFLQFTLDLSLSFWERICG